MIKVFHDETINIPFRGKKFFTLDKLVSATAASNI